MPSLRKSKKAAQRRQRLKQIRAIKTKLHIEDNDNVQSTSLSDNFIFNAVKSGYYMITSVPGYLLECLISLCISTQLLCLSFCEMLGKSLLYTILPIKNIICYFASITIYSIHSMLFENNDESSLEHTALFDRIEKLEKAFVSLQNKNIKMQRKLEAQQILLAKKQTTKVIHIKETIKSSNTPTTQASSIPLPPPISAPPPPPPMMPPPPISAPRKLVIPKKINNLSLQNKPVNTVPGISLENVLGARGNLKKIQRNPSLPKPQGATFGVSLNDITSIRLRKTTSSQTESESRTDKSNAPVFRLRSTCVQRSPGGTPMKENIAINLNSPANILTNALRKKFKHTRSSPDQCKSKRSPISSPYESPGAKKPLSSLRLVQ